MSPLSPAPARIDADLYDDLSNPARQSFYPRNSRSFVRIDHSIRAYWHTLFDTCPQLLELSGPDGAAIFVPFMAWARERRLSFNWTYFLWVYQWLLQSELRDRLSEHVLLPIMTASATRWMMLDRDPDSCAIVLGSASLRGAVVASKYKTIYSGLEQVEYLEFEEPLPAPDDQFGYFVAQSFELDYFPGWRPIPQ
jgi:uncharacterized repeat protein (TIGR04061 family)